MKEKIKTYKVQADLIKAFMDAFFSALANVNNIAITDKKNMKLMLLNQYEHIAYYFQETMFPIISVIHNKSIDEVVKQLKNKLNNNNSDIKKLFRIACVTEKMYTALETEYKRNFSYLLEGRTSNISEHVSQYVKLDNNECMDIEKSLRLLVRTVIRGYIAGLKASNIMTIQLSKTEIIHLLVKNTAILILEAPIDKDKLKNIKSINDYILTACNNKHQLEIIQSEMDNELFNIVKN